MSDKCKIEVEGWTFTCLCAITFYTFLLWWRVDDLARDYARVHRHEIEAAKAEERSR